MIEQVLTEVSRWAIPFLFVLFLVVGWCRKIPVYEAFVQGAAEGFQIAVRIIPYLVAMFVAIKIFRVSGAMDIFARHLKNLPLQPFIPLKVDHLPVYSQRCPENLKHSFGMVPAGDWLDDGGCSRCL
jgi:spore maturation protein B